MPNFTSFSSELISPSFVVKSRMLDRAGGGGSHAHGCVTSSWFAPCSVGKQERRVVLRLSLVAWVLRRLFRLARTPQGRRLLLLLWSAAARWYLRRRTVAGRM